MSSLFLVPSLSLFACLALIPVASRFALIVGLVDRPDGRRKLHNHAVPVTGGLAIFASLWFSIGVAMVCPHPYQEILSEQSQLLLGLFLGSLLLVVIGMADDFGCLRSTHKLLGQSLAIAVVLSFGVNVQFIHLFGWKIELGFLAWPFTFCLLLGALNSINLIDGMDGLLGSTGLWLSLALAGMAALTLHWWAVLPALALAGALLGFLRFNLPPASIFMGDAGSMVVGLTLGTLAIQCSLKAPTTVALLMPLGLLTMPFFDTAAAIVRRTLTGRSIYSTDRAHMHHCLLGKGFSPTLVLVIVSLCCLVTCAGVLASQAFNNEWIVLLTTASIISILVFTRIFGFAEAMLVKNRVASFFQLNKQKSEMQVRLQGTRDWQRLWKSLTDEAIRLNLQKMTLDINAPALHEGYHARWSRNRKADGAPNLWRLEIPLLTPKRQAIGRLLIAGQPENDPVWSKIASLTKIVADYLGNTVHAAAVVDHSCMELANPVSASV